MRKLNRAEFAAIAGPFATAMLLGAPGRAAAAGDQPQYGGELVYIVQTGPPTYDAHREGTFTLIDVAAPHYSTLLRVDPFDKLGIKIVGDLAERWTASDDGKTYTFKLRRGVKFHDGSPMTSRDVKAHTTRSSFRRLESCRCAKASSSACNQSMHPIRIPSSSD